MDKTTTNALTLAARLIGGLRDCLCLPESVADVRAAIDTIGRSRDALALLVADFGAETDGSDIPNYIEEAPSC